MLLLGQVFSIKPIFLVVSLSGVETELYVLDKVDIQNKQ